MKLEDQVLSLEYAKKLKELGVKQESLWFWVNEAEGSDCYLCYEPSTFRTEPYCECYSAFTVCELLSLLNARITIGKQYGSDAIMIIYEPEYGTDNSYNFVGNNLADLLSKALIAQHNEGELDL